jgi:hypothetical protein
VKVSFSTRFPTLREGIERDHCDNSKDNMCVVLFWKNDRPNSVEYFEYHALYLRLEAVGSTKRQVRAGSELSQYFRFPAINTPYLLRLFTPLMAGLWWCYLQKGVISFNSWQDSPSLGSND